MGNGKLLENVNNKFFSLAERLKANGEKCDGILSEEFLNDICKAEHIVRCVAAVEEPGVFSESAMEAILQCRVVAREWKVPEDR